MGILWTLILALGVHHSSAMERHYYIVAKEVDWDYAPSGRNLVSADSEESRELIERRTNRIGSIYKKAIYRGYTDETFSQPIPVPEWAGLLGPPIKAEVGDVVFIHFQNWASGSNFSIHPHGFLYNKANEGALYIDGTSGSDKYGDAVPPGGSVTYVWFADKIHAPTPQDDNCVAWGYHSHTRSPKDIDTGLIGIAVFCRKGILDRYGNRLDVDKELYLYPDIANENNNWYFDQNLRRCGDPRECWRLKETENTKFVESNRMHHINGFIYGNLPDFPVCEGESVVWYFASLNLGVHTIHANGQTMIIEKKRCSLSRGKFTLFNVRAREKCDHYKQILLPFFRGGLTNMIFVRKFEGIKWGADKFLRRGRQRIGSVYKKAVYREYTDATFTMPSPRGRREIHYGLAGPPVKAEVGERVIIVVSNRASRPYSFLANGVSITKANEGAFYKNNRYDDRESGFVVRPGSVRVYEFDVTTLVAPTPLNTDCITYMYHSAVDLRRDIYTGLFGPLLVCKPGTFSSKGKQFGMDREFFLNWMVIDENLSWYIDENINAFTGEPWTVNKEDGQFKLSNEMKAINGRSFGTLRGLNMCLGDHVSWHMYGLGQRYDHHHFSFEGNNFLHDGRKLDTTSVMPGIGHTVVMIPDQAGRLLLRTGQLGHESEGLFAWYDVNVCTGKHPAILSPRFVPMVNGVIRRYYIGVIEGDWEYCPEKIDPVNGESLLNPDKVPYRYVRDDPMFVGSVYYKAIYREFTDETFFHIKPRRADEKHLGILGPFIRGNAGDTIEIVFRNFASFPYNIVPRNVVFKDGSPITSALPTMPGQIRIYRYYIPERSGPLPGQPNCFGSMYASRVTPMNDTYSGLFGPFVICKPGVLDLYGRRTDEVTKEFATAFVIVDENKSNYRDFNFATRAPARQNTSNIEFVRSNNYNTINGLIYGNLKGLIFNEGERSAWYIFGMGSIFGIHTVHFHGQLYVRTASLTLKRDVLEIFSGTYETVEMLGYNPGTWLYHCHLSLHTTNGMKTTYTVLPRQHIRGFEKIGLNEKGRKKIRRGNVQLPQTTPSFIYITVLLSGDNDSVKQYRGQVKSSEPMASKDKLLDSCEDLSVVSIRQRSITINVVDIGSEISLFADDTSLYIIVDQPEQATQLLQTDIQKISRWADTWLVQFNPAKSESLLFSRKANQHLHLPLFMAGLQIPEVSYHQHLGVTLSNDCKWHHHINYITCKAWKRVHVMRKLKMVLDRRSLETIYLSFIRPILEYADVIWNNCTGYEKEQLDKIENECARIVTGATKLMPYVGILLIPARYGSESEVLYRTEGCQQICIKDNSYAAALY
ncbi:ferroxidase HEPHL1-like [Mercenaria mercenaria]|uniref:ferroxidase HEPHL1-like n=1 Tax=Mercenaria mercenaria TaxID=6596 RepID=UPI00234E9BA4|nr:ferroxidase HEPHL1-like [Mercenaria mercenaria]